MLGYNTPDISAVCVDHNCSPHALPSLDPPPSDAEVIHPRLRLRLRRTRRSSGVNDSDMLTHALSVPHFVGHTSTQAAYQTKWIKIEHLCHCHQNASVLNPR